MNSSTIISRKRNGDGSQMDNLLEELKKNVSVIIHTINEDNLEEVKEEVSRYFQLAEVMIDLIGAKKKAFK